MDAGAASARGCRKLCTGVATSRTLASGSSEATPSMGLPDHVVTLWGSRRSRRPGMRQACARAPIPPPGPQSLHLANPSCARFW